MRHAIITTAVATVALSVTAYVAYRTFFPAPVPFAETHSPIVFQPTTPVAASDDPRLGSPNPKHTIIMFGDFQCAGCADAATALDTVLKEHPDVQLVWKDAPNLTVHPWSMEAAIGGRCAAQQGKFWQMHDALFATPILGTSTITQVASDIGLDRTMFESCRTGESTRKRVTASLLLAETLGITATPFFYIDGKAAGVLTKASEFASFLK